MRLECFGYVLKTESVDVKDESSAIAYCPQSRSEEDLCRHHNDSHGNTLLLY